MKARPPIEFKVSQLPRELLVLGLVVPFVATPVLSGNFLDRTPIDMLQELGLNYAGFLSIGAGIHALYRWLIPFLVPHARTIGGRVLIHVGLGGLIAGAIACASHPLVVALFHRDLSLSNWLLKSVVVTWTIQLPVLVLQELRVRAEGAERRLLTQQQAALSAQLEALRSRTNPHFLFNAMNTVASLIQDDPERAEHTLERLADVLRYALQASQLEAVPLAREIAMVSDYLEVQRARFGDRLQYAIAVEPGLDSSEVPPLLLQPLVENAVLHGVAGRAAGGRVRVTVCWHGAQIRVRVDDDGPGPGKSQHRGTGTSLHDLQRRLELLYGPNGKLLTRRNDLGGFSAELTVPAWPARSQP